MMCFNRTADVVNENDFMTDLADAWDKVLQLKNVLLALLHFSQRRAELLKQIYAIFKDIPDQ